MDSTKVTKAPLFARATLSAKATWHANKSLLLFITLMFVFRSAVADWNYVPSSSMNPTLVAGDRVVVNKLAYNLRLPFTLAQIVRWSKPTRGDVITFDSPKDEVNLIKRVIALGGDKLEMRDNVLFLNGAEVKRTLVAESRDMPTEIGVTKPQIWREQLAGRSYEVARLTSRNFMRDFDEVTVPAGHVMVMGDSRDNSNDSRFIGFIDIQRITGRAHHVAFSHDVGDYYIPRANRWWLPLHQTN